jgi:hypothetical protein
MILEIHGKAIAFGMQWRTLTGNAPAPDLAAKVAKEVKAARIWHDGAALHMGYLAGKTRRPRSRTSSIRRLSRWPAFPG